MEACLPRPSRGGGGLTPAVRVDNHFAAFAPWDKECMAGMRKESEVHVFYDIHRVVDDDVAVDGVGERRHLIPRPHHAGRHRHGDGQRQGQLQDCVAHVS